MCRRSRVLIVIHFISSRCVSWALTGSAILLSSLAVAAPSGNRPSFSCDNARGMVAVVCASSMLSAKDRTMDALYRVSRVAVTGGEPSGEVAIQRQWLRNTEKACSANKSAERCFSAAYDERNQELAIDALFGAHEIAMAELRSVPLVSLPNYIFAEMAADRQAAAAVYEAIYRYATVDPLPLRVAAVAPLIAPLFATIKGRPWASPINDQREPRDAIATDQNFAAFLAVASVSVLPATIVLPCGALVRRPGLIDVLHSYYGGAIDGHLIGTTCDTATVLLPAFDGIFRSANDSQEPCSGTIRFSLGRDTARILTAIRLHRMDVLAPKPSQKSARERAPIVVEVPPEVTKFLSTHGRVAEAAQRGLAAYYSASFHVPPGKARADASFAVRRAVQAIYGGCE